MAKEAPKYGPIFASLFFLHFPFSLESQAGFGSLVGCLRAGNLRFFFSLSASPEWSRGKLHKAAVRAESNRIFFFATTNPTSGDNGKLKVSFG
jgi:hypothetical protein